MKLSDLERANKIRARFNHLQSLWNGRFDERHHINADIGKQHLCTHVLSRRATDAAVAVLREEATEELAALREEAAQIGLNLYA